MNCIGSVIFLPVRQASFAAGIDVHFVARYIPRWRPFVGATAAFLRICDGPARTHNRFPGCAIQQFRKSQQVLMRL
jgi:hypothetical protein